MTNDRRRTDRTPLEDFAFIQIGRDDGGKVLNLSEGGLCFELSSPQQLSGPIPVWFSLDLRERIEVVGELAWIDATQRIGGLKFLSLSDKALGQISARMKPRTSEQGAARKSVEVPPFLRHAFQESPQARNSAFTKQGKAAWPASLLSNDQARSRSGSLLQPDPPSDSTTHLVPFEHYRSSLRRQLIRGLVFGILIASAVAWVAFKLMPSRENHAALQPPSGQRAGTILQAPTEAPVSFAVPDGGKGALASAAGKATPVAPAIHTPEDTQQSTRNLRPAQSFALSSGTQPAPASTQPQANITEPSRKVAATPQQLWSAVQAGNAAAAVTLADLYIRGDGVPRNCDQARVLLLVASEKHNAAAIKKLHQLDETGCPTP